MVYPRQYRDESGVYLKNIGRIPLVSRAEESQLATEIKNGSGLARIKLIESNLRLVVKIAHDFKGFGLPFADLVSEGNIGMMRAAVKFDPAKGAKFSSYAAWWIKQSMRRALTEKGRMIRVPVSTAGRMIKIQRAREAYKKEYNCEPSPADISRLLGCSVRTVARLMYKGDQIKTVSLSEPIAPGEKGTVEDLVADSPGEDPLAELVDSEYFARLRKIVDATLNPREKAIIYARYGLNGNPPKTLEEVSKDIGRTRERVRQIQNQALTKLRLVIEREKGEPSGPEAASEFMPARQQEPAGHSDEQISAYYRGAGQRLSAVSKHFGLQVYLVEAALIRTGAIPANPDMKVIEVYFKNNGNIKMTAKELNISSSKVSRERMRYLAGLAYEDRQKRAQLKNK